MHKVYHYLIYILISICLNSCRSKNPIIYTTNSSKILYKSSLNKIKFHLKNNKEFDISITNGKIDKISDDTYSILIDSSYTTTLILKQENKIQKNEFRVYNMPEPELRFWTKGKGDINNMSFEEFRTLTGVAAVLKNFQNDCIFKIISLDIIKIDRNGVENKIELLNPKNNDFHRIALQSNKGNIFIFRNIKIEIQDTRRIINGKEITVYLK